MRRLLMKFLPAVIGVGAIIISAPYLLPKTSHQLPGPDTEEITPSEEQVASDIFLQEATVQRVIDGDTIIVNTDEESDMRIRFIGMDTPESVHPDEWKNTEEGLIASDFTMNLLPEGSTVYLEKDISDTDRYDRYLRYIWLTEEVPADADKKFIGEYMVNGILIKEGLAEVTTYEPDTKYEPIFNQLAQ